MVSLLPYRQAVQFSRIEPYGFIIILVLLFTKLLDYVMWPLVTVTIELVSALLGIASIDLYKLIQILSR